MYFVSFRFSSLSISFLIYVIYLVIYLSTFSSYSLPLCLSFVLSIFPCLLQMYFLLHFCSSISILTLFFASLSRSPTCLLILTFLHPLCYFLNHLLFFLSLFFLHSLFFFPLPLFYSQTVSLYFYPSFLSLSPSFLTSSSFSFCQSYLSSFLFTMFFLLSPYCSVYPSLSLSFSLCSVTILPLISFWSFFAASHSCPTATGWVQLQPAENWIFLIMQRRFEAYSHTHRHTHTLAYTAHFFFAANKSFKSISACCNVSFFIEISRCATNQIVNRSPKGLANRIDITNLTNERTHGHLTNLTNTANSNSDSDHFQRWQVAILRGSRRCRFFARSAI